MFTHFIVNGPMSDRISDSLDVNIKGTDCSAKVCIDIT